MKNENNEKFNDKNSNAQNEQNDDFFTKDEDVDYNDFYPDDSVANSDLPLDENTVVFTPQRKKTNKRRNGKLSPKQIVALVCGYLIFVAVLVLFIRMKNYKPSAGNSGEIPFDTNDSGDVINTSVDGEKNNGVIDNGYTEKGESYNILVVGHDKLAHLADVTMIVNCNTKDNTVTVMQIPRDTYVAGEYLTGKINAMYSTYYSNARNSGSDDPYMDSMEKYAALLEKNLCINIHHTVIMNLDGFKNIVDSLGGVDVYVPNAMYYEDPEQGLYISIPAGMQHLDGYNAEGFVRFRSGYVQADLGRVNAQKIFLTALFSKVKSTVKSVDIATLNNLITVVKDNVYTDLTTSDIMFYAKLALKIDLENITMMTLPGSVSGMYYVMNRTATLDAVNTYFNVYNKDISDAIFDRNRVFCDTESEYISAVYYDDPENVLDGEYTADSIDGESIYIPRTQTVYQNYTDDAPENDGDETETDSQDEAIQVDSDNIESDTGSDSADETDIESSYEADDGSSEENTELTEENTDLTEDYNG